MLDWRDGVRRLANLGAEAEFPLLVFRGSPPSALPWPAVLAPPSASVQEFYQLCDGGYFGGHHRLLPIGELLAENQRWWEMLADSTPVDGEVFDYWWHVILGCDMWGFPLVWDRSCDQLARLDYRDTGGLFSLGQTLPQFMEELFTPDYPDDMWQEALRQLRDKERQADPKLSEPAS